MGALFGPFERLVRDLTRAEGKEARLLLDGANIELDRKILEQIRDPLMHMLRNAIDHGVEAPDLRQARGKPRSGTIRLTAALRGGSVQIELADDGAGLDPLVLRQTAVRKGLLTPEQAAALDDAGLRDLIFRPGFSTSQVVTELSGRGVGMDVVRIQVEQLNGQVAVFSAPGEGTRFTLTVPLTLATTRALLVAIGHQLFAVPAALVERAARVRPAGLTCVEGWLTMQVDGQPVPVVELAELLGCGAEPPSLGSTEAWRWVFLLRQGARRLAILVDLLVGEQELVVKPLSWPLQRVRHVAGAAVLGSGQTALILNPLDLLKAGLRAPSRPPPAVPAVEGPTSDPAKANLRRRLLIVDDSLTTRTLVRSILEAAGYEVLVAADGVEALDLLRDRPIDLVVTDVDMPGLDGFGLTAEIRRDPALQRLPVVLVTSLEAREHRERGVKVGADAYIVKRGFDQAQLLDTIRRLL